ncbi:alkyl sulfatase BDS1-like metallo-beta-lactamase superfamily hydrolase [Hamadaea flava]|uniref:Alkyl/aryl-sulfatase n=1 Tax=Hamadaea flava TaxID=1742688 RepID=A0ABV8LVV7_9ACTN|nr:alkyl sulfatase dimerization domain-containing protein [Hamadaea flava]MCP2329235.1 alkyl sulfatase BDS1-like metallo-beta-lactamase superfamily hydrolase [Hamadaea flava]
MTTGEMIFAYADRRDFDDADRGLIAALDPAIVRNDRGEVVWDNDAYTSFLTGDAAETVHPSLWRQSTLVAKQGLFEVTEGIYQVRGLDLSNISFVEGETGVIVIDPLISVETAAAALALYRANRGERPVTGVIYTHSHVDHFGGVKGVVTEEDVASGRVPIIAPEGFLEHAISENVYAGTAMARRAGYMYGAALPRGPQGQVGAGLGQTTSTGLVTLIKPTVDITETGQALTVDGVRMVFQLAPGTEAPAEMHFLFPDRRALCMAENATHTLHNLLTLRGAVVRDPHAWARYLTEAIELFAGQVDVVFASHHWPTWGADNVVEFLSLQRDLYAYLHDQTVRMINKGLTGIEIAELMQAQMPPELQKAWHTHGYYGSVSHNVKAIYQRYMGWYDGNPARLWQHPPQEAASRYVDFMGGADVVVEKASASADSGDLRWAAQVLDHVVFAEPDHKPARTLLADVLERLGFGVENGTWRNVYLSGAYELRQGNFGTPTETNAPDVLAELPPEMFFDALAVQVDGPKAWDLDLAVGWRFPDHGKSFRTTLRNGVFSYVQDGQGDVGLTATVPRSALPYLALGDLAKAKANGLALDGDTAVLQQLMGVLDPGDPNFNIIEP